MTYGKQLFTYMGSKNVDFSSLKEFKIPIYFFVGRYDYITSDVIASQYFATIKAPAKELFWFEHSGHSPAWEEPELFYQRVLEVAAKNKINSSY